MFHPRYFISSECFAEFIGGLDLSGKHVVDIGTGSGILALAAARAGAENVTATDINPNAALTAAENARANGMGDRVAAVCTNLLSALAPRPLFEAADLNRARLKHAGRAAHLPDRGSTRGDPKLHRDIAALFDQSRERLKPGGRLYVMVSSDSDLDLLGTLIDRAGFSARVVHEHSIFIRSFLIVPTRFSHVSRVVFKAEPQIVGSIPSNQVAEYRHARTHWRQRQLHSRYLDSRLSRRIARVCLARTDSVRTAVAVDPATDPGTDRRLTPGLWPSFSTLHSTPVRKVLTARLILFPKA